MLTERLWIWLLLQMLTAEITNNMCLYTQHVSKKRNKDNLYDKYEKHNLLVNDRKIKEAPIQMLFLKVVISQDQTHMSVVARRSSPNRNSFSPMECEGNGETKECKLELIGL